MSDASAPAQSNTRRHSVTVFAMRRRRSCRRWTPPSPTLRCRICREPVGASYDLVAWVLTSSHRRRRYRDRTGRLACRTLRPQELFIACAAGFTIASISGLAQCHHPDRAVPRAAGHLRRSAGAALRDR